MKDEIVQIESQDFWIKIVGMLQQNWAVIETNNEHVQVYFMSDRSGVFDVMEFDSEDDASKGLALNGFVRFAEDKEYEKFHDLPQPPYHKDTHPNGPIYSSGKFWVNQS